MRLLRTAAFALLLFPSVGIFVFPAYGAVTFPADLFGVERLADQIRSPIGLKIRDMRKAFGTRAQSSNAVDFVDANGSKSTGIRYVRTLNAAKTKRFEEAKILNVDETPLIVESISTEGTNLDYSDPAQRAYFDGPHAYSLLPNENLKTITLRIGYSEAFRFKSSRSSDRNTSRTEIFFGGTLVLTVVDVLANNGTERILEYRISGERFSVGGLGSFYSFWARPAHVCRIVGVQTIIGENFQMSCDGKRMNTYAEFSQTLSDHVFSPLFAYTAQPLITQILRDRFPIVQRPPNLATSGKMYSDILNILALLDPHRTTPAVLTVISTLRGYVSLIQDGTIEIRDNR
jgi:hypothetical protein